MVEQQDLEPEHRIQKWAPQFVGIVLVLAVIFYFGHFPGGLSDKQSVWGQFGDFIGGLVNPIIGFFTIWLLAVSLRQNHKALHQANLALNQANVALDQAKAELALTRTAIEQAADIQAATEDALKKQIEIAAHARDMNNAVAIHEHLTRTIEQFKRELGLSAGDRWRELTFKLEEADRKIEQMEKILEQERSRLVDGYSDKDSTE